FTYTTLFRSPKGRARGDESVDPSRQARHGPKLRGRTAGRNITFMIWTALASRRLGGSRDGLDLAFWAWTSVHRRCDRIGDPLHPSSVRMVHLLAAIRSPGHGVVLLYRARGFDSA